MSEFVKVKDEVQLREMFKSQLEQEPMFKNQGPFSADLAALPGDESVVQNVGKKLFYMVERQPTPEEDEQQERALQYLQQDPVASRAQVTRKIIDIKSIDESDLNTLLDEGLTYHSEFPYSNAGNITMPRFVKE